MQLFSIEIEQNWNRFWFAYILEFENKLSWRNLSRNPNITMNMIKDNPDKPWDWDNISSNPNITMDMISDNPDKPWNWKCISRNPNLTIDIITKNPDKPWDWFSVCQNDFMVDKLEFGHVHERNVLK